jgi:hypothetical protein
MAHEINAANYQKLALAAKGAGVSIDEMLERILDVWLAQDEVPASRRSLDGDQIPVYAIYKSTRVEALFDPKTEVMTGTTAPIEAQKFSSPSGAARAVVEALNPEVNSNRSGPRFWRIAATGKELATVIPQ